MNNKLFDNKKGAGPPLTWIFIGITVSVFIMINMMTSFVNFSDTYNINLSENFTSTQSSLQSQYSEVESVADTLNERSFLEDIWDAATDIASGSVNIFVTGLTAIAQLFKSIDILTNILSLMGTILAEPIGQLITLAIVVLTIYIAMRYLQSRRGASDIS